MTKKFWNRIALLVAALISLFLLAIFGIGHKVEDTPTDLKLTKLIENHVNEPKPKEPKLKCGKKGVPCEYDNEVAVRFIILTFNRAKTLTKCLQALQSVVMDNATGAVEIWIDRNKTGHVHLETLSVAEAFRWNYGPKTVHVWPKHVGLYGQWIDTWRPKERTKEMAVFLEDDVDISPFSVRWARAAYATYGRRADVGSIGLADGNVQISSGPHKGRRLTKPKDSPVFLYRMMVSWGTVPIASKWRQFQDWYHEVRASNPSFKPYTRGADLQTSWYRSFERQKKTDTMWTLWYISFCDRFGLFTVHPNLPAFTDQKGTSLAANRMAPGLHFRGKERSTKGSLLTRWDPKYVDFPAVTPTFDYNGSKMN